MAQMLSAVAILIVVVGNHAFACQAVIPTSPDETKPAVGDTEKKSTESDTFKVTLALDSETNPPQIEWSKPFRVVLRNESSHTIRILNPNSEQGYQQYTIEFSNERTGVKHIVKRVEIEPEYWKFLGHSNGSNTDASELNRDVLSIQANGNYEYEITLSQIAWGERAWTGLPIPNTDNGYQVTLLQKLLVSFWPRNPILRLTTEEAVRPPFRLHPGNLHTREAKRNNFSIER